MNFEICFLIEVEAILAKGNPLSCNNVCHPKTPTPIALPLIADLTVFSMNFKFLDLSINSCNTPSKNQVVNSGSVIPFSNL